MPVRPFLRRPGGKRQIVDTILAVIPDPLPRRYVEPFVGGGAVYFVLRARGFAGAAMLSDTDPDLIGVFLAARDRPDAVVAAVEAFAAVYDAADPDARRAMYYALRDHPARYDIDPAARVILLNRLGYNGLARVNRAGECNVPWGRAARVGFDADNLRAAAEILRGDRVLCEDFAPAVARAEAGDVVYADPPYGSVEDDVDHGFTAYTPGGFAAQDHRRLVASLDAARDRGVLVVLTNGDHAGNAATYAERGYIVQRISERRAINSDGKGRGRVPTLLAVGLPR